MNFNCENDSLRQLAPFLYALDVYSHCWAQPRRVLTWVEMSEIKAFGPKAPSSHQWLLNESAMLTWRGSCLSFQAVTVDPAWSVS
jgi:hypothetical protein